MKPVLCYRVNVLEETAHPVADPPVELEPDAALKSSPPPSPLLLEAL